MTMMQHRQVRQVRYIGLDVHKVNISVAVAEAEGGAATTYGKIANEPSAIRTLMLRPGGADVELRAGPTGYALHRQLTKMGIECLVAAPSLIPKQPRPASGRGQTAPPRAVEMVDTLRRQLL